MFFVCYNGTYEDGKITVDNGEFQRMMRKHNKLNAIVELLTSLGFFIENFNTKTDFFTISYKNNPNLISMLYKDSEVRKNMNEWDGYLQDAAMYFSYRWVEAIASQKYEKRFLFAMDHSSEELRELQYWLYDKAKEYGYHIPEGKISGPYSSVYYQKGSKDFLRLCEDENAIKSHLGCAIFCKIILKKIFNSCPDIVLKVSKHFPDAFKDETFGCQPSCGNRNGKPLEEFVCNCHINYEFNGVKRTNCSHSSFYFRNPKLDDMPLLLELFVLENNIKPVR